jgi:hypothetical protein
MLPKLDARAAGRGFTDHDARQYLVWTGSLMRTLPSFMRRGMVC